MAIRLSPETEKLIEQRLKDSDCATHDELVRRALEALDEVEGPYVEDLDAQTQVAITEGLAQADRGETRPWSELREKLKARFVK